MEHRSLGRLRDGGARAVGRGERPDQDVVEIGGQAAGPRDGRRAVSLGGRADRIKERGQGGGVLPWRGPAGAGWVSGGGLGDGGGAGGNLAGRGAVFAQGPACGQKGNQTRLGLVERHPDQPAVAGADVPVRGARCVVRGGDSGLFPVGSVGWQPRQPPRRLLSDRRVHGTVDHRLWRGAGRHPAPAARHGAGPHGIGLGHGLGADPADPCRVGPAGPPAPALAAPPPPPPPPPRWLTISLVAGLLLFGFVLAVNSALHSYLILALSRAERVSQDVGFYYMANAAGRLIGTLLSGISYQIGGLSLCLATAGAMAAASALSVGRIMPAAR